jgi:hypothetical protein
VLLYALYFQTLSAFGTAHRSAEEHFVLDSAFALVDAKEILRYPRPNLSHIQLQRLGNYIHEGLQR